MWDVLPFKDIFGAGFGIRDPVQVSYRGPGRNRASSGRIVAGMRKVEKEEESCEFWKDCGRNAEGCGWKSISLLKFY